MTKSCVALSVLLLGCGHAAPVATGPALSGEEVQLLVAKIYAMPPDIIAKAKDAWVYKAK